jgi:anti-sigma regulatory factor (Ser/Thr protein kinase)
MNAGIALDPEPRSVPLARAWVSAELEQRGRADLCETAELGVSELVTNALLHADPPIVVRVRGTDAHPRVEVLDGSPTPPALRDMTGDDSLMATIGRGLGIVATYSRTWGAEVSGDGKVVWFEPAADPEDNDGHVPGHVFDISEHVERRVAEVGEPESRLKVRLVGMPVRVFARYRVWYEELRRELRLLALTHGTDTPIATELSELTIESARERRQARGVHRLDEAMAEGLTRVDLEYDVPPSTPATMGRLRDLLTEAIQFCRDQRLLTLAPSVQQVSLLNWYHGEFERQGRGEEPRPWTGAYEIDDTGLDEAEGDSGS